MEIKWDENFDPAYGIVSMHPHKFIYYRGYKPAYPAVSERPAYFGSLETASAYAKENDCQLDAFTNSDWLRLIDVRFMKDILRNLFEQNKKDVSILPTILSFGICSLSHQIQLASIRFQSLKDHPGILNLKNSLQNGLFEQQGVRVAETTNDAETMGFLKSLFEDFIDGFISPRQISPFHTEKKENKMNAEMIIFNPLKSGIRIARHIPSQRSFISMKWFYNQSVGSKIHVGNPNHPYNFYVKTGGDHDESIDTTMPIVEQINMKMDEPEIQDAWNRGLHAGERWKGISGFGNLLNPHPTYTVSNWTDVLKVSETPKVRKTRKHKI